MFSERTPQNKIPVRSVEGSNLLRSPRFHEVHLLWSPRSHKVHLLWSPRSHKVLLLWNPGSHEVHLPRSPGSCGSSIRGPAPSGIRLARAYVRASNVLLQARIGGRPDDLWTLAKQSVFWSDRPMSFAGWGICGFASSFSQSVTGSVVPISFILSFIQSCR